MKFKEVLNRLTGISTPILGVSWNPPDMEVTKTRRVLRFLEDRRVLYNPYELELPRYCVESVMEIRKFLTTELTGIHSDTELAQDLKAMRAACRKFLDAVQDDEGRIIMFGGQQNHYASWVFQPALGEFRGVFGVHIAKLAAGYGLDIEDDLAKILPGVDRKQIKRK